MPMRGALDLTFTWPLSAVLAGLQPVVPVESAEEPATQGQRRLR